ncbi:MAG: cytochrome c3 family protein [Acidobacteriota bacterium]
MRYLVALACLLSAFAAPAWAQTSRCADCHVANADSSAPLWSGFAQRHLEEWDHSPHARNNVGCERCHGGDATTFESFLAHQGILPGRNPASPVHRANLPRTCGSCHTGPFVSFQKSRHYEQLRAGNHDVPTCSTCHGEVAADLLSPKALGARCDSCHGPKSAAPRPERAANARLLQTEVRAVRESLNDARAIIRRMKAGPEKTAFEEQWQQAEVPLIEARQAGHQFVFENLEERLSVSKRRIEALLDALANRN